MIYMYIYIRVLESNISIVSRNISKNENSLKKKIYDNLEVFRIKTHSS